MAAVVVAAAIVAFVMTRGGVGKKPASAPASASGADPWGGGGGSSADRGFGKAGMSAAGAGAWLRARPAGPPVMVSGIVRMAPGGAPVPDAEVAFMNATAGENTAMSDSAGRYEIKVASGIPWQVHARTDTAVGYPESFVPSKESPVRDLEVHPTATVRGRVVDRNGGGVGGAEVSVHVDAASRNLLESAMPLSTIADDGGRFEVHALPGALTVKGAKGLRQGVATLATLAPGESAEVEIKLVEPVVVSGTVVDGEGRGVAGAKVLALVAISEGGPTEKNQFDTKEDGAFEVTMPAGWLRLEARRLGEFSTSTMEFVAGGTRKEGVIITLAPAAAMRGKVVTTDGSAVSGARVRLVANSVYDSTTSSAGTFAVSAIAGQPYLVKIRHTDGTLDRHVAAWNGEEVFVMKRFGALRVVVEGARGEVNVTVDSFVGHGEQAPRAPVEARFRGLGGTVLMPDLESGLYDLTITAAGAGSVRMPRVAVAEGGSRDVKVKLSPPVAVRGTVRTGNQPVAGARVVIAGKSAFSDSKGRWTVADVAAGPIGVVVSKTGFGNAWGSGVAEAEAEPIDIELRPSSDNTGLVEGVGVVLAPAARGAVVTKVLPGSPAEGKLAAGDLIEEVGGTDVTAASLEEIVARVRGSAGSSVSLEIRRGDDTSTVDVVRKRLVVPPGTPPIPA